MTKPIRLKPEPACPDCGTQMVLRRPKPGDTWEAFWGCPFYPDCRGTRDIKPDGTPEEDNDWLEDLI
jgi:ssDNA-binding Zn-finger/Zn-ribbon topoisomerase 1